MMDNTPYAEKQLAEAGTFTRFLWWLSTAEKELLEGAAIDSNRYSIVGMTVLTTWVFATAAWTYFFSTVTDSVWMALPLGLMMGFIILTIDRALIKSINRRMKNRWLPVVFRVLLASVIGMFMAQPALLYLFKKEIKLQVTADNTNRLIANRQQLDSLYKQQKAGFNSEKNKLKEEIQVKYADVQTARDNFLKETDGSGGTGKVGIAAVAIAKRYEYLKLDSAYKLFVAGQQPKLNQLDSSLTAINVAVQQQEAGYAQYFNDGFLTQIEALQHLLKDHPALQYRYYLLMAILLLIELMPLISKLLLPAGTYDEKVQLRETMEKELANEQVQFQKELITLYQTISFNHDKEMINTAFDANREQSLEKMKNFSQQWKADDNQPFKKLLQKIRHLLLINKTA